jgi:cold shock CspA family protein
VIGIVWRMLAARSFGFIRPVGLSRQIFFHRHQCLYDIDFDTLRPGDRVEFEIGTDATGKERCYNVSRVRAAERCEAGGAP